MTATSERDVGLLLHRVDVLQDVDDEGGRGGRGGGALARGVAATSVLTEMSNNLLRRTIKKTFYEVKHIIDRMTNYYNLPASKKRYGNVT